MMAYWTPSISGWTISWVTFIQGVGLGLAIVKKIIDEHHGTITIENGGAAKGAPAGAAVSISLPLAA